MAIKVALYNIGPHHRRSGLVCAAMAAGIKETGDIPIEIDQASYREPVAPVALFYGFIHNLPKIMRDYREQGLKAVYVDLGYWGRVAGGRWSGYHKLSVNSRHPTEYFQARPKDNSRAAALRISPGPWRSGGRYILLAGMGDKAAEAEGMAPESWERSAIAEIRKYSDRPIVYRPKPSWKTARPIDGAEYSPPTQDVTRVIRAAHAVVTHHSNVAVDGIVAGIPAFCWDGVAKPLSSQDISKIETPRRPEGRVQWVRDIAWVQWNILEMRRGRAWKYLKDEGLVP